MNDEIVQKSFAIYRRGKP